MIKYLYKLVFLIFIFVMLFTSKDMLACSGSTLAGNITPTNSWQTIGGVQAGDRFTFAISTDEVIIFSFCQGGGSYTNDPRIDIHDNGGTMVYESNDDHCGYGAELVWVCPAGGTYSAGFYEFFCLTDGTALGTVAYKLLPTPTEQDCLGALPLCTSFTNHPQSYTGTGHYYDIFDFNAQQGMSANVNNCPNCLVTGELNNVWYTFTAQSNGDLAFTIDPVNNSDDYDWALYSLNGGVTCLDLIDFSAHPPVSCNYAYVSSSNGNTGVGSGTSLCVGPVADEGYCATFAVTTGQTYVLTVSNFSSTQNGYSINFGASTATIIDNSPPALDNVVYMPYCGSSSLTVQFSESVWCSSVQPADFELTGPAGTYSVINTQSIVCESAAANTYAGTWYDDIWTLELGDLLSQSGDYVLTLAAGSVEDKCTNVNVQNQLFFTIVGITADLNVNSLCGCNGQSNGDLSVTNIAGGTAPYVISWTSLLGFTSSLPNITNLPPDEYTLTITDAEGICEFVEIIDLGGAPVINPTASNNSPLCEGETITFDGGSDDPASTYSWSGPGAYSSAVEDPTRPNSTIGMAGTYLLTVTDSYGCQDTTHTNVVIYAVVPVTISANSPYCEGEDIILNATTVIGASYAWTGPGVFTSVVEDPTITNCVTTDGGTYNVIVTDANTCTTTANIDIVVNAGITVNFTPIDPLCFDEATGQITINPITGTTPFSYTWPDGSTANPATSLIGDVAYCVSMTDATGCTFELCHTLTNPPELVVSTTSVPTECGYLDGEIIATISGGAGGYSSAWTEGHTGAHITGLHPGDYIGTVTDVNGCTTIVTETVDFFGAGVVTINQIQDVLCFGDNTAVLTSDMTGGTLPYTYEWSESGQISANLASVGAGIYSVSIIDTYGCSGEASHEVLQPELLTMLIDHSDVLCRGEYNGSATANVVGGVFPYIYTWEHGPGSSHISALNAGVYSLVVEDLNGCTISDYVEIEEPDKIVGLHLIANDVSCTDRFDGMALAQGDGGTPPYTIYWFQYGQLIANGEQINSLHSGDYTVELFDDNNCAVDASFSILEPSKLEVYNDIFNVTCKGYNDGRASVSAIGGTSPYEYLWNTGDTISSLTQLVAGNYYVTITDGHGCLKTIAMMLSESNRLCLGIPDAFTPNADGINDTWDIEYIEMYPSAYVNVFNRWGQHVYQGTQGSDFWDGKFNGKFVPAGAYQYVVDLRNGMEPFTGVVVVVY